MLLENMTIDQLNEVFDADNLGTIYPVQDLTPKAKVPQMLHIKVPGTNDLLVRLTHLDTVGTRVKAVQPGDKTVQVFLMSLSEKGNITDFRGGLGTDPVGAINTIFTTVLDISKKFRFDSVLFRIPKNKMKGQERAVQRVLSRLIKNRSGGRFTTLDEIERDESKKFSFVMAYRKNSDVLDQVPLSDNIEKVETKAGDTFIDKDTGKQVSKAEAVASEIVKKAEKITTKM
ncbi:putative split RNA polymerase ADP-ribosylase [Acinetobacter phage ZZ1]|uniref:Split RNA polymerase ADP-ribosylase n=1 Tax=Acinetobacter phage ZZ1 TaxID=1049283 RepID=I3WW51_9CAUD|nr:putative split RNA polymerase ADP-ribosylase [Acinetobacter phage ZZ1]AFL47721.1 putative split RNA polymerase ADP-ribosylase [Acinetobacter phage ZZ1]